MASVTASGGKPALRFLTCGSVDDGKSSLIGRLLLDIGQVYDDQLVALRRDSRKSGLTDVDLDPSLLVDGLEAERQQGITIDVAYRYFRSKQRAFIVADCPGHEQYTRNMATGASNAEAAILLVDARKGLLVQTYRHAHICALFGIRHVMLAVNKIDLIDHDQARFDAIAGQAAELARELGFQSFTAVPVSALRGDNVVHRSQQTAWHHGPTVLDWLEQCESRASQRNQPMRLPIQWVCRPDQNRRAYAGTLASGTIGVGDPVEIAGRKVGATISRIHGQDGEAAQAVAGDAVMVELDRHVDVARGDIVSTPQSPLHSANLFVATLIWLGVQPLAPGRNYLLIAAGGETQASVSSLRHRIDVNTRGKLAARTLEANEIGLCHVQCARPLAFDTFADNRTTGSFILVDRETADTVAAGIIEHPLRRATNLHAEAKAVDGAARANHMRHRAGIVWMTGLSGSGKSTLAKRLEAALFARGVYTYVLDGDNLRLGINRDLGFTEADRIENIRRAGEIASLMADAGLVVICALISPFRADRELARSAARGVPFLEVFVDTPLEECRKRDPKGLYAKVDAGLLRNFTGVDSPYEPPASPDLHIRTMEQEAEEAVTAIIGGLDQRDILGS